MRTVIHRLDTDFSTNIASLLASGLVIILTLVNMTKEELHELLTNDFRLVIDPVERGDRQSYFLERVDWHPSSTTRILHVQYDQNGRVTHIKRCVSPDNNNGVLVPHSLDRSTLGQPSRRRLECTTQEECGPEQ